ncbi:MAG: cytochrome d ubiquinol oxidase subunit II, partial [Myxococcaceae bacterium]
MPEYALAAVMLIALCIYMLTAGADFGGGILDLFSIGPRAYKQRDLIAKTLAPIWEANHVWLILIIVLLFVCFPPVFETMSIILHIPITLLLIGIVLRGSAFAFRSHDAESAHKHWSVIFAIGSIITPFMLGLCLGTIASGRIPLIPVTESLNFAQYFITPWLQPFPILVGILTLWLCALLSSLYLLQRTSDFELQRDFRIRAFVFA